MPTPKVAKARSAAVMSLTRAPLAAASASFTVMAAQTPGAVRDAHVIGVTVDHAYWNGSAFDLPIGTNWFQIFLPNPTQADFVQVDWSPDLLSWTNVGYFRHYTNGIWLVDPTAQGLPMRFYRLGIPAVMQ